MVFEKIKEIIIEQSGVEDEKITLQTNLKEDLNIDSLDLFQIINDIEEFYDVKIDDVDEFNTVEDVVKFIESNKK